MIASLLDTECRLASFYTRPQFAELLIEHYQDQKAEALEHLGFAIREFHEMKMQPSLERALKQSETLKA